ncbi:MAG: helix-turn-helix transcriptional regulator [Bacilli bacterium]|nr:helix-turn-helix transcriptional regulator [Bacilli bacterium]
MDQLKIGKFISSKRKEANITQSELAEKLGITDRAISKWENGLCLPDAGTMPELCDILGITINDLFSGEVVDMKDNEKRLEENLLELAKMKEETDKRLLHMEWVIGYTASVAFFACIFAASYLEMESWIRVALIVFGSIVFLYGMFHGLKIEQTAGYYECKDCHHKYVPDYFSVFWAMHVGRTRYMKCPKCHKWSWQKKVIKK